MILSFLLFFWVADFALAVPAIYKLVLQVSKVSADVVLALIFLSLGFSPLGICFITFAHRVAFIAPFSAIFAGNIHVSFTR
jgi:hypothetical protein